MSIASRNQGADVIVYFPRTCRYIDWNDSRKRRFEKWLHSHEHRRPSGIHLGTHKFDLLLLPWLEKPV